MAGKHADGRRTVVGKYVRKWRGRPALAIVGRLVAERNANLPDGVYAEPFPCSNTVTRHNESRDGQIPAADILARLAGQ